ncbi:hypothetical protein [Chryseobacterium sp. JUb7]|uniref:hypothetical protein n=1 Tax=Chryseobacterium sp. JUb7 TaxID=2940599 RepID=UPI00216939E0|nr:hypothetical protein [Chryseobacterium sp. JUb7]MCS3530805.1 hypothetical protein [Chryseobacterium sp. JUb7]
MKKIIKIILLIFISFYWILTLIYNSPNNYIRIKLEKEIKFFSLFFEQKWNFFAPPPQDNYKLYFTYLDQNKNQIAVYEVFSSIIESKRNTRPFNLRAEMIDYTIYGSLDNIMQSLIREREKEKIKYPELSLEKLNSIAREEIIRSPESIEGFLLLKNYSKIIGTEHLNKNQLASVKYIGITINSEEIKKFAERDNNKPKLESNLIDFNPYPLQ